MRRAKDPEVIYGRVNGDGTINAGERFTVQRTGAGQYVLTFEQGFRFESATGSGFQAGAVVYFSAPAERSVNVTTYQLTTAAVTDLAWAFDAKGFTS